MTTTPAASSTPPRRCTASTSSSWPSGSWEDLQDPLPSARSANQAGFCTTAKAGGEIYSIGGFTNFVWNNQNLHRVTGEGCGGGVDVPWVSEDPATGTVEAGASIDVTVTVDASVAEVDQPGPYRAELVIAEDTPHSVPPVPVTMNVTPPADWGKASGTITGLGECDAAAESLEGATVQIGDFTVETDDTGLYEWWLAAGTYPITVSADGYVGETDEVVVTAGATSETDFELRLDAPCPSVSPDSFEFTVPFGGGDGGDMTITNDGAGTYDFRIRERDRGRDIAAHDAGPQLAAPGEAQFSPRAAAGPASALSAGARATASVGAVAAPASPDWQTGAPVPAGIIRYAFATCEDNPEVFYVISGVSNGNIVNTNYRYDAATDTWTTLAPIPVGQEGPNAALLRRPDLHHRRRRLQPALRLRHRGQHVVGGGAGSTGGGDGVGGRVRRQGVLHRWRQRLLPRQRGVQRGVRLRHRVGQLESGFTDADGDVGSGHGPGRRVPLRGRWLGCRRARKQRQRDRSVTT